MPTCPERGWAFVLETAVHHKDGLVFADSDDVRATAARGSVRAVKAGVHKKSADQVILNAKGRMKRDDQGAQKFLCSSACPLPFPVLLGYRMMRLQGLCLKQKIFLFYTIQHTLEQTDWRPYDP